MLPVILGVGLLYGLPKTDQYQGGLLAGYCKLLCPEGNMPITQTLTLRAKDLFSFLFSANPLIVSWMGSNIGGNSMKSAYYVSHSFAPPQQPSICCSFGADGWTPTHPQTSFNAFSGAGNIVAPYLFK